MIKDGRAFTSGVGFVDDGLITDHPMEEQDKVFKWIRENIIPVNSPYYDRSSYGLKHILERDTDIYLTNNEFKDAMLICGYDPVDPYELNWHFCISKKSPAFRRKK